MVIQTSRFGSVQITKEDLIQFPEGLLGFNDLNNFVLLDDPNDEIFAWLQSCEEPGIAFPVLEPELFTDAYNVKFNKHDLASLGASAESSIRSFSIITIPEDPTQMTANLKAPVVINIQKRLGRQCVLQDSHLNIREPIFSQLQQRVVQNPASTIKSQATEMGVAIKLPNSGSDSEPSASL